jgi:diguanylate cyclase (GGDEF)-like protein
VYRQSIRRVAHWLCPTEFDRKRAVDTSERVKRARTAVAALIGVGALVLVPEIGWVPVAIFAVQMGYLAGLDKRMQRSEFPEVQAAAGMLSTGVALTASIVVTGGPESPLMPLYAIPVSIVAARFRPRVVMAGVVLATTAIVAITLIMDPGAVINGAGWPTVALTVVVGSALIAVAIQGAEVQHRHESVIDPLTGLLNRKALETRFLEIEQQAQLSGGSVCLIEFDLDHFKRVNDLHGHARGDEVLQDLAYDVRKALRTFELVYRIGGEEFVIVLPGAQPTEGLEIAERVRALVEERRPGGIEITVSLGVAHAAGRDVRFRTLYAEADQALYVAKARGRNRVATGGTTEDDTVAAVA